MRHIKQNNLTKTDLNLINIYNKEKSYFEQWEEPVHYDNNELSSFNVEIFPGWLRNFVYAVAESTQTPVDMAAITILSIATTKKYEINPYGDWVEPLNTYCLTLMGPANRKSSVFREMYSPVTSFEKEEAERLALEVQKTDSTRRSLQKRIETLKPPTPKMEMTVFLMRFL